MGNTNATMGDVTMLQTKIGIKFGLWDFVLTNLIFHKFAVVVSLFLFLFIFQISLSQIDNVAPFTRVMNGAISTILIPFSSDLAIKGHLF